MKSRMASLSSQTLSTIRGRIIQTAAAPRSTNRIAALHKIMLIAITY
jgi:hypothetical protein